MTLRGCWNYALLFVALIGGPSLAAESAAKKWDTASTKNPATVEELKALQASVKSVVEKVTPAVVSIQYGAGVGSGVIVSDDGLVFTAAHVVTPQFELFGGGGNRPRKEPAEGPPSNRCRVMLPDGKYFAAEVLGRNSAMDSAILKITEKVPTTAKWPGASDGKWPKVEIGKSTEAKLGQWVVSLGHPGGPKKDRQPPVRLGQIDRIFPSGSRIVSDCTLVGGDSGGPLFDLNGRVIGIHSSIRDSLAENFHVPTAMFERDRERMVVRRANIGMKPHAYMGVSWVYDKPTDSFKPVIDEVVDNSPAANAGLIAGDVIINLNGAKITSVGDVEDVLSNVAPGSRIEIHVKRGTDVYELEMTLVKRPKS
jgi:serine protease Do